jgi:thioredoxin
MQDEVNINSLQEFRSFIVANPTSVFYFSTPDCNVCKVLKPKFKTLLKDKFPNIIFAYINISNSKELAAQNSVFAVPTIIFFFDGKELIRKSRNVNLYELENELERPYSMLFGDK